MKSERIAHNVKNQYPQVKIKGKPQVLSLQVYFGLLEVWRSERKRRKREGGDGKKRGDGDPVDVKGQVEINLPYQTTDQSVHLFPSKRDLSYDLFPSGRHEVGWHLVEVDVFLLQTTRLEMGEVSSYIILPVFLDEYGTDGRLFLYRLPFNFISVFYRIRTRVSWVCHTCRTAGLRLTMVPVERFCG